MLQTKTAAPVLQHRDGQTKNFITCILPHISPICKAFANFTLTACGRSTTRCWRWWLGLEHPHPGRKDP